MISPQHLQHSTGLAVRAVEGADLARYGDPSPCADFAARDVVNHIAFALLLAHCSGAREGWDAAWSAEDRCPLLVGLPEDKWAATCADEARAVTRVWSEPSTWDGETTMGGGTMPAAAVGAMMTAEFALHGWDLAVATGQPFEVSEEHGAAVLEAVLGIAGMGRDGGWFGAEVPVPSDAPAFERALAASGRDPRWTA